MRLACLILLLMLIPVRAGAQGVVDLGRAEAPLHGPWKFATGDDMRRADPRFDDRGWETVSLAPAAGAHDPDVGLAGYVPGWMLRGHAGYHGFAWYRLRIRWSAPAGGLVLLGPPMIDDAYQVYWNGRLIGGVGDFSHAAPVAYAAKPTLLRIPETRASGEAVVAIRTFLTPSVRRDGDAGGIHIAPVLATRKAGEARHVVQWTSTILGYVADAIEPLLLLAVAGFALFAGRFEPDRRSSLGFAAALALTALLRANQVFLFWFSVLSIEGFTIAKYVLLQPLCLLAWVLAWNRWPGRPRARLDHAALGLATVCGLVALAGDSMTIVRAAARLGFAICFLLPAVRIARDGPDRVPALLALLLVAVGQFAEELSAIGLVGIWFPFGVGVSRTQYALALLIPLLVLLFARRALRRQSLTTAAGVTA
jgi:hypothetical protein